MNKEMTVTTQLAAARLAGDIAGERGGVWTHNANCTLYIVAASTSEYDMRKANRWATISVNA